MIWRSFRLSHLPSRNRITNSLAAVLPRHSSALRRTNSNVATILATPPPTGEHLITAAGSVRTVRNQKHCSFVELGDGSTTHSLQAVLEPAQAEGLGTGTSVEITGVWRPAPPGKEQSHELKAENVRIIGVADAEYPIQKKYHSAEFLRSLPHLRLRTPLNALLARMRSESDFHLASFFRDQHFVRLQPPIITSSDCEGAGEVFTVSSHKTPARTSGNKGTSSGTNEEFFKAAKFLTVSSQLHLEAFVHEHTKVWTLSPTFRAEKSDTPRHVSEFWMLEAEIRTESLQEVMDLVEDMVRNLITKLQESGIIEELIYANRGAKATHVEGRQFSELLDQRWQGLIQSSWPRISYQDAVQHLQEAVKSKGATFQREPSWSTGLLAEHERYIAAAIGQGSPLFVTNYPMEFKPFYMLPSPLEAIDGSTGHETVACFDLLLPEVGEVVGGSLREHRLHYLTQSMRGQGLNAISSSELTSEIITDALSSVDKGNLNWYVDLRRYGSVPHGGFGLGFDRLLGYLAGIGNIKDIVPWPRHYGRCEC